MKQTWEESRCLVILPWMYHVIKRRFVVLMNAPFGTILKLVQSGGKSQLYKANLKNAMFANVPFSVRVWRLDESAPSGP